MYDGCDHHFVDGDGNGDKSHDDDVDQKSARHDVIKTGIKT